MTLNPLGASANEPSCGSSWICWNRGKVGTHEGTIDTTDATKKEVKMTLAELDVLLDE